MIQILCQVVIAALTSGFMVIVSHFVNDKANLIATERQGSQNTEILKQCISEVYASKKYNDLIKIFPHIKRCLNPYYTCDKKYFNKNHDNLELEDVEHDIHIWLLIKEIESCKGKSKGNKFENYKNLLALYLSCSSKFDWDRHQNEINPFYKPNFRKDFYNAYLKINKKEVRSTKNDTAIIKSIIEPTFCKLFSFYFFVIFLFSYIFYNKIFLPKFSNTILSAALICLFFAILCITKQRKNITYIVYFMFVIFSIIVLLFFVKISLIN